jgi:hypothetical protein
MKYVAETGLFLTLVVIPFPLPKIQVYIAVLLVPMDVFVKFTVKGEQPEFTLGVKSATSWPITGVVPASNKIIANR